ncbi:hypothetical protein GQR58_026437 [Nymphon striatum]|nr:hypothetical protein GQR58_026437 [Nymphon striatum]
MSDWQFTHSCVENLIDEVKSYPWLFDTARKDFKDQAKKKQSWCEIAARLNKDPNDCQEKWRYIRSKFSRVRHKDTEPSGSATRKQPTWSFYESMSFFSNYVINRKSAINNTPDIRNSSNVLEELSMAGSITSESALEPVVDIEEASTEISEENSEENHRPEPPRKKKKNSVLDFQRSLIQTLEEGNRLLQVQEDEDYHFCMGLYKRLGKFSDNVKDDIKCEIQSIICKYSKDNC